jgi:hypothetical protein
VDPVTARKTWRTLEPLHGLIYFAPEATEEYAAIGLVPEVRGYFASRAAPMGSVPAEVVIATFFNFRPGFVHREIPRAWSLASPDTIVDARFRAASRALRSVLGAAADGPEVSEAAALTTEGIMGIEALVIHGATGEVPRIALQGTRGWTDDEWDAAVAALQRRGWLTPDGSFTYAGRAHRQGVEDRTDALALPAYEALGDDACARLRTLVRPLSKAIVESSTFTFTNRSAGSP